MILDQPNGPYYLTFNDHPVSPIGGEGQDEGTCESIFCFFILQFSCHNPLLFFIPRPRHPSFRMLLHAFAHKFTIFRFANVLLVILGGASLHANSLRRQSMRAMRIMRDGTRFSPNLAPRNKEQRKQETKERPCSWPPLECIEKRANLLAFYRLKPSFFPRSG
jgi:hypothetical protein